MKEKTFQKTSLAPPDPANRNLGLMIGCGNCRTIRVFKIDENLKTLTTRKTAGFLIEPECEKCGHYIAATIAWINARKPGYSYRKLPFWPGDNVIVASDENGLSEAE